MGFSNNDDSSASEHSVAFPEEDYDVEVEEDIKGARAASDDEYESEEGPYGVEPLASAEYLSNYNRVVRQKAQEEERLTRLYQGIESLDS